MHIDYIINLGSEIYLAWVVDSLSSSMEIRDVNRDTFVFCGLRVTSKESGFVVDQENYSKDLQLTELPVMGPNK